MTRAEQDGWAVVTVAGEMDLISSPAVRQKVHDAVAEGRRSLVLDLAGVRFCDSSGVGVLIGARRLMRSCAGRLRIVLPHDGAGSGSEGSASSVTAASSASDVPVRGGEAHVNRVLAALGVRRLFEVYPDLDAATDDTARPLSA
ncbi:STAS domain-containing protein [Actinacidiphila yanglinensis]|uniref:STAS domain-containing protein n=1 Tax=Actinacidiphila yanglinensis TaxID=310779 RepID=UPI000CDE58BA|nr:STAS domain-containing protein [Actinacidiphila yanglinensis]